MPSFFEKLKRGMGIEEPLEESAEREIEEPAKQEIVKEPVGKKKILITQTKKERIKKPKKLEIKTTPLKEEMEEKKEEFMVPTEEKIEIEEKEEKWPTFAGETEGQLAIDVYQTENDLVIQSAIAGIRPENLDISLEKDIITIKGLREKPFEEEGDYFSQECYWGSFSREIILPAEVDPNQATAKMKEGILTIRIPKILREKKRRIVVTG